MCEQIDLFNNNELQSEQSSIASEFGCCHLYRECSEQKKCLQPIDYAKGCAYYQNLCNGNIFYGKNSSHFHSDRYKALVQFYLSLSDEEKTIFRDFVIALNFELSGQYSFFMLKNDDIYNVLIKCPEANNKAGQTLLHKLLNSEAVLLTSAKKLFKHFVTDFSEDISDKKFDLFWIKKYFFENSNNYPELLSAVEKEFMLFEINRNDNSFIELYHDYIEPTYTLKEKQKQHTDFALLNSKNLNRFKSAVKSMF